jgi:nifR3 family TIM-barrel protein
MTRSAKNRMSGSAGRRAAGFWSRLPRPIFAMAPMANVTDCAMRKLIAKYGKPDVMWTEFVSADGLVSVGGKKLLVDLEYSPKERPIVAQLFTGHPEAMKKAAAIARKLGFDGLDVNMGCPDRAVERQGGGAAMMKDQKAAIEVLAAAREGFKTGPVSVKTRLGYKAIDLDWIKLLLEQKLAALTVHLRTRKEMSDVPAHWESMPAIIKLRNQISPETLIIGNGDVENVKDGLAKIERYGCDGVMIGRGIFGKPWLFENVRKGRDAKERTPEERLKIMLEHAKLFEREFCGRRRLKNFAIMRKHFKAYVSGWDGAKELRVKLMKAENAKEVQKVIKDYLKGPC